jgi:hypothetical protein
VAYVSGFDNDVFLSYAHIDNENDGAKERWVECFGKQLSAKLLKRMGETVAVWWDPKLDRSQIFDEVIQKAVKGSAIMVSLVSPAYVKRDYCKQEVQWFAELGNLRTPTGHSRVFPALVFHLPFDQWPGACQGVSGFEFFDSQFGGLSKPLDIESQQFSDMQWKLVSEIAGVLDEIRQSGASAPQAAGPDAAGGQPAGFRVYLAASSDDLVADRSFLKKELQKQGIEVISKIPPPYAEKEHAEAVRKAIGDADLSLHLLCNSPGSPIDEDIPDNTFSVAQTSLALDHARSQLILLPDSFALEAIEEPKYAQFMKELQERPRQSGRLQIIKAGRAQMLEEILAAKKNLEDQAAKSAQVDDAPGTAFVDLHIKDLIYVADLVGYLAEKKIAALTVPSAGQSPASGIALFEQNLRSAQLFIVVYGGVAREWVLNRVFEGFKLITTNGLATRMGVYVAPPDKPPEAVNFGICDVMLNTKRFDPATIEPLLAHAHRSTAA